MFFGKDEHQNGGRGVINVAPPDTAIRILGVYFSLGKPTGLNDEKAVNLVRDTTTTLSQKGVIAKQVLYVANRVSQPAVLFLGKGTGLSPRTLDRCDRMWRKLL